MRVLNPVSYSNVPIEEINQLAISDPEGLIYKSELYYYTQLQKIVTGIVEQDYRVVLLAGPSASGKTTTAFKLKDRLIELGVGARVLSMDDFFKGVDNYPLLEDGTPDMESVKTLDIPLLNEKFQEILTTGISAFPVFDFTTQTRSKSTNLIRMGKGEVLIMEGLHALNPEVLGGMNTSEVFRLYLSVRTKFTSLGKDILRPPDIRLLRRMVRDSLFRNHSPLDTAEYWSHVLESEHIYINPYRDKVDFKMDTMLDYEVCVWHTLLHNKLKSLEVMVLKKNPEVERILEALELFQSLDAERIPAKSVLREFIGKSL